MHPSKYGLATIAGAAKGGAVDHARFAGAGQWHLWPLCCAQIHWQVIDVFHHVGLTVTVTVLSILGQVMIQV